MKIRLKYHSMLASQLGRRTEQLDIPGDSTIAELREILLLRYPMYQSMIRVSLISLNGSYVKPESQLRETDEVVLLPPISGG